MKFIKPQKITLKHFCTHGRSQTKVITLKILVNMMIIKMSDCFNKIMTVLLECVDLFLIVDLKVVFLVQTCLVTLKHYRHT